jgi:hypothetical protein
MNFVPFDVFDEYVPAPTVHQHGDYASCEVFACDVAVDEVFEL